MALSSLDLLNLLQQEVNDTSPDSTTLARYKTLLNRAHRAIVGGGGELNMDDTGHPIRRPFIFPWALAPYPKILTLLPFQDGTADTTQLSNSVTNCSINSSATDLTNWHIRFRQFATVYRIISHSGTTLTLDSEYIDDSTAGETLEAFKLVYTLGADDILLITDKIRLYSAPNISAQVAIKGLNDQLDQFPMHRLKFKVPESAAIIQQNSGTFTLQFSHYPDTLIRAETHYVPIPSDLTFLANNYPLIPDASGHSIVLVHLAAWYHLRKRDDDRAASHMDTAKRLFDSMTTEAMNNINSNDPSYGQISPWSGGFDGYDANGSIIIEI
jgi:hypothetical protein